MSVSVVAASAIGYAAFHMSGSSTAASAATPSINATGTSTAPSQASTTVPAASYPLTATVNIPKADRFEPFALVVGVGATVTWTNQDTDAHTIAAMPTAPTEFRLTAGPGASVTYTFTQPGLYGYYCDVHSVYDPATGLVKANKGADAYPISMYGIVLVAGPGLDVAGGRDKIVVPGADRFAPLATVVHAGTAVAWTDIDADAHSINSPPGATLKQAVTIPAGKTGELRFDTPGVYTYYCAIHASWDSTLQRAQALTGSSEYPAAMEGVVFVVP